MKAAEHIIHHRCDIVEYILLRCGLGEHLVEFKGLRVVLAQHGDGIAVLIHLNLRRWDARLVIELRAAPNGDLNVRHWTAVHVRCVIK